MREHGLLVLCELGCAAILFYRNFEAAIVWFLIER